MKLVKWVFLLLMFNCPLVWAQKKTIPTTKPTNKGATKTVAKPTFAKGDKVELISANVMEGERRNGVDVRKFKGKVVFKQKDTFLYCDSAFQYPEANNIEAFSHVRITQGDTVTLTGDSLFYNGNQRYAKLRGNVVLQDRAMTLTTSSADYDLNTNVAAYYNNGRIVDKENTLTSQQGFYNTQTKLFTFKKDVKVVNPKYEVTSDTMHYSSASRVVYLKGPSKIVGKDGILYANDGEYNTASQVSNFTGRAKIDYGKYTLTGDRLYYDKLKDEGFAEGNVESESKDDKVKVYGDFGRYWGKRGITKVYGNALMKNADTKGDTSYLAADTLISLENKKDVKDTTRNNKNNKKVLAFNHVQIYKSDLQGKCDSLVYNFSDSTIYFFRDPVLWSGGSQMEADSMHIQMANNKIDKMFLKLNSFVISEDSLKNYNQIKGKTLTAFFNPDSKISRVNVEGNGESLYFALDDKDSILIGMNRVECSRMVIRFAQNKVNKISFITKPDAMFIPPHELEDPDKRLKGFLWRIKEKPTEKQVVYRRRAKVSKQTG